MPNAQVFLVESDPFRQRLMSDLAQSNGMRARVTDLRRLSSELMASRDHGPHIVVLDLEAPRSLDTLRRLRALPDDERPRVIGLAEEDGKELREARRLGVEETLELPFSTGCFARALSRQAFAAIAAG